MGASKLTSRQAQFVDHYVRGKSAAAAARAAGYGAAYSERASQFLLARPKIAAEIDLARQRLRDAAQYDTERAVAEIDDLIVFARAHKNAMAAAKLTELKLKLFGLLVDRLDMRAVTFDLSQTLAEARARSGIVATIV
jgi:phage terminase small subunit